MDRNVKKRMLDGLRTYQSQLSKSRGIRRRLQKNKQELERTQREKLIEKEDLEKGDPGRDGGVALAFVEGAVEEKGANEDADIKDAKPSLHSLMQQQHAIDVGDSKLIIDYICGNSNRFAILSTGKCGLHKSLCAHGVTPSSLSHQYRQTQL